MVLNELETLVRSNRRHYSNDLFPKNGSSILLRRDVRMLKIRGNGAESLNLNESCRMRSTGGPRRALAGPEVALKTHT